MTHYDMITDDILKKQLATPLSQLEFTAFDFETTGLYAHTHTIIEIGAVKFSNTQENFDLCESCSQTVREFVINGRKRISATVKKAEKEKA